MTVSVNQQPASEKDGSDIDWITAIAHALNIGRKNKHYTVRSKGRNRYIATSGSLGWNCLLGGVDQFHEYELTVDPSTKTVTSRPTAPMNGFLGGAIGMEKHQREIKAVRERLEAAFPARRSSLNQASRQRGSRGVSTRIDAPSEGRDIEEAVHAQGFLPEGQDMVEAIHGTSNVSPTSDPLLFQDPWHLLLNCMTDQEDNDGKGIGLCILVLLITSFILSFTPLYIVGGILILLALILSSVLTCKCCCAGKYEFKSHVGKFISVSLLSQVVALIIAFVYAFVIVGNNPNVDVESLMASPGAIAISAIGLSLELIAIIFTGLFVWGRDINTNPQLRCRAIMLSSLVFVAGLSAIIIVSITLGGSPDCYVKYPSRLGNGVCDGGEYNTEGCSYDGGDCTKHNTAVAEIKAKYPDCKTDQPELIGNGGCKFSHNTKECGFDGGDCIIEGYPDCLVDYPYLLGDGVCDGGAYNTEMCGYDGGDCTKHNTAVAEIKAKYPDCKTDQPELIGNGGCKFSHNTKECGFDGGDCIIEGYPDCLVDYPYLLGDGVCDGGAYNTEMCGYDGGDCTKHNTAVAEFNKKYPDCHVDYPSAIGNGKCNGGEFNTEECGWDGGDCIEFNKKYPDCKVRYPFEIGNGVCNAGGHNTEMCGWDGGDCVPPAEEEVDSSNGSEVVTAPFEEDEDVVATSTTSSTALSTVSSSSSAAVTTQCVDTQDYLDMYGGTCNDYELPGNEEWCKGYGDHGEEGLTPNENCCVCKEKNPPFAPSSQQSSQPSSEPSSQPSAQAAE